MEIEKERLTGCLLPKNSVEITAALAIHGWIAKETFVAVEWVDADPVSGTPEGWSAQITGPAIVDIKPNWLKEIVSEVGHLQDVFNETLHAKLDQGAELPLGQPIFTFGWDSHKTLILELLDIGFSQFVFLQRENV